MTHPEKTPASPANKISTGLGQDSVSQTEREITAGVLNGNRRAECQAARLQLSTLADISTKVTIIRIIIC